MIIKLMQYFVILICIRIRHENGFSVEIAYVQIYLSCMKNLEGSDQMDALIEWLNQEGGGI